MKPPPAREPPVKPDDGLDRGVAVDDVDQLRAASPASPGTRCSGRRAMPPQELARVLLREEALRHDGEEIGVEADHREQDQHHQPASCRAPSRGSPRSPRAQGEAARAARASAPGPAAFVGVGRRRSHAHIIGGGRERDDERDHHRRRERHRELAEQPPDAAAHEQERDEHGDQRQADREHREADLAGAEQRRLESGPCPGSMCRVVFSSTTIASSTTKPVATVSAIRRQVVEAEAEQVHHAERAEQRDDRRDRRDERRARVAEEQRSTTTTTSTIAITQRHLDLVQRGADRTGAVGCDLELDVARQLRLELGQERAHRVHGLDDVGGRLASDQFTITAGWPLKRPSVRMSSTPSTTFGDVAQAHRGAIAPRDHHGCDSSRPRGRVSFGVDLQCSESSSIAPFGRFGVRRLIAARTSSRLTP